jgi:hypothetical protein
MKTVIDPEVQRQHDEIDERAAKAMEFQTKLGQLQTKVDLAEDALINAEQKRSYCVQRIEQLKGQSLDCWCQSETDKDGIRKIPSPFNLIAESWASIMSLNSMLADFPRVKQALLAKLRAAQDALGTFQRSVTK